MTVFNCHSTTGLIFRTNLEDPFADYKVIVGRLEKGLDAWKSKDLKEF